MVKTQWHMLNPASAFWALWLNFGLLTPKSTQLTYVLRGTNNKSLEKIHRCTPEKQILKIVLLAYCVML